MVSARLVGPGFSPFPTRRKSTKTDASGGIFLAERSGPLRRIRRGRGSRRIGGDLGDGRWCELRGARRAGVGDRHGRGRERAARGGQDRRAAGPESRAASGSGTGDGHVIAGVAMGASCDSDGEGRGDREQTRPRHGRCPFVRFSRVMARPWRPVLDLRSAPPRTGRPRVRGSSARQSGGRECLGGRRAGSLRIVTTGGDERVWSARFISLLDDLSKVPGSSWRRICTSQSMRIRYDEDSAFWSRLDDLKPTGP